MRKRRNSSGASFDPYLRPAFPVSDRIRRAMWHLAYTLLFRPSPKSLHAWRAFILRRFGAQVGEKCAIYSAVSIWAPWNLVCGDVVSIANGAIVYNPSKVVLGSHAIVSQEAYLCGATHDFRSEEFPLVSAPITIGPYAWLCARSTVQMGLTVGEGAVLALGSVATKDLEPWTVYGGIPARKIGERRIRAKE